jgi:hypothetical protein
MPATRDSTPLVRLIARPDGTLWLSASDRAKLDRIEWLRADNEADPHPSFERIARLRLAVVGRAER